MDKTSSMYLSVKLNWDTYRFLPAESKDCMNSVRTSIEICRLGEGHKRAHGNADHLLENLSREDHENVVN